MKKLLYGTTALVAAGMITGGAQAADKIKVGIGGYFYAFLAVGSDDDSAATATRAAEPGNNRRSHRITREGEIIFTGKTTLDNGIQFGVQVQLEAEQCGDQIDETFMWASGSFGRVNVGSENSAAYAMHYTSPAASHWSNGLNSPGNRNFNVGGNSASIPNTNPNMTSDSEKITYFTPRMAGFQLGASYTPENCEEANGGNCTGTYGGFQGDNTTGTQSEVIELGANYSGKIGGASIGISASWGEADVEGTSAANLAAGNDDREEWSLGAKASMNGFSVGAAYYEDNNGTSVANSDDQSWTVGLRYATGPWGFGIQYANFENESGVTAAGVPNGNDELDAVEIGGSYDIGPGIKMLAGIQFVDLDDNANSGANENDATVVFFGTFLSF
ncbi:MAG: porin [Rhodospirillaceae bacterium]|nr:porin [Rhodospirillaceae bacterium]